MSPEIRALSISMKIPKINMFIHTGRFKSASNMLKALYLKGPDDDQHFKSATSGSMGNLFSHRKLIKQKPNNFALKIIK
jgi:hypothetical protein